LSRRSTLSTGAWPRCLLAVTDPSPISREDETTAVHLTETDARHLTEQGTHLLTHHYAREPHMTSPQRYTCEMCKGTYTTTWTWEEAQAEAQATFTPTELATGTATICDTCWRQLRTNTPDMDARYATPP